MQLTSISFLAIFLPLGLFLCYLAPKRRRPGVLLAVSLLYYILAQPLGLMLLLFSVLLDYGAVRMMEHLDGTPGGRRWCVWFSAVKTVVMILYTGTIVQVRPVEMALGLSVYTLSSLDCVISCYRREVPYERSLIRFGLYCCFFPRLYAGPLIPYPDFVSQLGDVELRAGRVLSGWRQLVRGGLQFAVLGGLSGRLNGQIAALPSGEATVLSGWMLLLTFAFSLFFRLSGLCGMAQGIGGMFGITLPRNFFYPFESSSVEDFTHRFNITVGAFIRRTIYAGLQEDRNGPLADSLNLLVTGILMGLWFGLRINYMLWGMYLALFTIMERYLYRRAMDLTPMFFRRIYALCVVLSSFVLFAGNSPTQSAVLLGQMFGMGNLPSVNDKLMYLLSSNWLLLVLCVLFSTSFFHRSAKVLSRSRGVLAEAAAGLLHLGLLAVLLAFIAS